MPVLAKYIRLSSADEDKKYGDKPESNSVTHQRMLLDSYISGHLEFSGYEVLEFLDDGRSGTNFTRPGVLALLGAAQRREIDCIIVKDDCVIIELNAKSPIKCGFCAVSSIF